MFLLVCGTRSGFGQSTKEQPNLADTLQFLRGASRTESGNGREHFSFETDDKIACMATITEYRINAPQYWSSMSFHLRDIDPADIQVHDVDDDKHQIFSIRIHTANFTEKISNTSNTREKPFLISEFYLFSNEYYTPRFVKALKHAAQLCGAKPSSF
jgi:hypothetical protein